MTRPKRRPRTPAVMAAVAVRPAADIATRPKATTATKAISTVVVVLLALLAAGLSPAASLAAGPGVDLAAIGVSPLQGPFLYLPAGAVALLPGEGLTKEAAFADPMDPSTPPAPQGWTRLGPDILVTATVAAAGGAGAATPIDSFGRPAILVVQPRGTASSEAPAASDRSGLFAWGPAGWTWQVGRVGTDTGYLVARIGSPGRFALLSSTLTFADIAGHPARPEIESLLSRRIIQGLTATTFGPDEPLTRAQFATLLARALQLEAAAAGEGPDCPFTDVPPDAWYYGAILAVSRAGLVAGVGPASFAPEALVSRKDMNALLERARDSLGLPSSAEPPAAPGPGSASSAEPATRAEAAVGLAWLVDLRLAQVPEAVGGTVVRSLVEGPHYELVTEAGKRYLLLCPASGQSAPGLSLPSLPASGESVADRIVKSTGLELVLLGRPKPEQVNYYMSGTPFVVEAIVYPDEGR